MDAEEMEINERTTKETLEDLKTVVFILGVGFGLYFFLYFL